MRMLDVEDPARMRRNAWDLDRDFAWDARVDVEKPLLPLAQIDRVFPGLADEERLVLSQLFGLIPPARAVGQGARDVRSRL